jgi:hypothetical protein
MRRFAIAAIAIAVLQSYGSTVMVVNSSNGSRDVYQLSDVQKMTFQSASVGVHNTLDRYRNTFSVTTRLLKLSIGRRATVSARLFSCNGRTYGIVADKQYDPGSYLLPLDRNGALAKGVYILQVTIAGLVSNQKMVIGK